ncbi:MAG: hypothetical protein KJO94_01170 [Eudoraea sp.]|nr:hypothetical protein [Eudoraea sp.]MBT8322063.1 hypothetical protein [Eudoraea sp.]NNJ41169.1 hypothetical protein [Eudoraea sp.]
MVRIPSILLAFLVLLQSSFWDMQDIYRIDSLVEHARFHSENYGDNFLLFISKHYGDLQQEHENEHQEEQSQHEELPFQHQSCVPLLADLACFSNSFTPIKSLAVTDAVLNFRYLENYASISKFDIFQPPRAA